MNSPKEDSPEHKGKEEEAQPTAGDETVIHSVARGVGTAIGVIASSAAKVMGKSETPEPEPKPKKPRKASKQSASSDDADNKHQASRMAKKKKKRAAHRVKLKRSNTKG